MTLQELRDAGYKVRCRHTRKFKVAIPKLITHTYAQLQPATYPHELCSKGGYTVVWIEKDNITVGQGLSKCSDQDNFCKRTGFVKALGRAVGQLKDEDHG